MNGTGLQAAVLRGAFEGADLTMFLELIWARFSANITEIGADDYMASSLQVVATIRRADDGAAAAAALQSAFGLSPEQTEGVLNLSLRRLTNLESQKLQAEAATLNSRSAHAQQRNPKCRYRHPAPKLRTGHRWK